MSEAKDALGQDADPIQDMEELITKIFEYIENLAEHVKVGCNDLVSPKKGNHHPTVLGCDNGAGHAHLNEALATSRTHEKGRGAEGRQAESWSKTRKRKRPTSRGPGNLTMWMLGGVLKWEHLKRR